MSSASRCQYIRGLIERRKAEIRTLEQQLEGETGKSGSSSTDTTLRIGESSSLHLTLQGEAALEKTGEEGIPSTDLSSRTKGTMQDIECYIQLCNKKRDTIARNTKLLQEFKNKTNLEKEKEREGLAL
ncbi:putative transcription factor bzip protein [Botrytis fragariae]|uniref:Putative transcription factor bzip protein n=1 Tax=Botrytis fragariae TaxID=1964551 RepID=A0A8H6EE23_9HELO|nr:putative transcription factor bzip protein [Botrytis fragariae]KAF5868741.1 putative transcription factor bzip protein [Botrytis fragariae]